MGLFEIGLVAVIVVGIFVAGEFKTGKRPRRPAKSRHLSRRIG